MSGSGRRVLFVLVILIFRVLLEIIYIKFIAPSYSYMGFHFSPDFSRFLISYIFLIFLALLFPENTGSLSRVLWSYIFVTLYVPASAMYWMDADFSSAYFFTITFFSLFVNLILNFKSGFVIRFRSSLSMDNFLLLMLLLDLLFFVTLLRHYGIVLRKVSLSSVYQIREIFRETSSKMLNYFINWAGNVINPYFFIYGLESGNIPFLIFSLLFQYYIFSLTGFRSLFFSLFFVLFLAIGVKYAGKGFHIFLAYVLNLWLLLVILVNMFLPSRGIPVASTGVRRPFFLPALVGNYYWDFFSEHTRDHFSRNFPFKFFFAPEYEEPIPYVIGEKFFHSRVHANANFIADTFANTGYTGVVVVWLIFLFLLKFLDDFSTGKSLLLLTGLTGMSAFSLTNLSLVTVMMTHGFLLAIFLILIHPERNDA